MFTKEHLIEEYRLPTQPEALKRRLRDIIKAHTRLYANTTNSIIKSKIAFFEEWEQSIVVIPRNTYVAPGKKR